MEIAISIIVTFLLTLANGFFSASELAVVSAKRAILEPEAEEGDAKAARVLQLASDSGDFLATIQVAITLVGFAGSAFAATNLSGPFATWMTSVGLDAGLANVLAPVLITLIVSYFSIVIGELVPKRIALADAEGVAKAVSGPVKAFMTIAAPLVWLTSRSADALANLMGIKSADERQNVSEEEVKYMVTEADDLTEQEKSIIHDVIDLGDTKAREVMVPRVDMTAIEGTVSCAEALDTMRRTGFSRVPVYRGDVDRIIGIAHIKDLIGPIVDQDAAGRPVSDYVRAAAFVPDTKDIFPLLSEMQSSHDQMVVVVDEYGGTAGIITIEDIVEEVVGEIADEFDPDNKYLTQLGTREWLVDGRFSIDDAIELGWPIKDSEEFETIAGFVLDIADSVPSPGDVFEVDGYTFRVQSVRGRRISLIRVTAPEPKAEEKPAEEPGLVDFIKGHGEERKAPRDDAE